MQEEVRLLRGNDSVFWREGGEVQGDDDTYNPAAAGEERGKVLVSKARVSMWCDFNRKLPDCASVGNCTLETGTEPGMSCKLSVGKEGSSLSAARSETRRLQVSYHAEG